jgi:hypothetical protein
MQDISGNSVPSANLEGSIHPSSTQRADVVSTHVLVPEDQAEKLRELSRKTRVAQSEYLREAVDDLLGKYHRETEGES